MGAMDKIYVYNYQDYQKLVEWAENKVYVCHNGIKVSMEENLIKEWREKDFENGNGRPVMYTSCTDDYFLIKHCPLDFIRKELEIIYDEVYIQSILDGTSIYDTFSKGNRVGTKCKVIKGKYNRPIPRWHWYKEKKVFGFSEIEIFDGNKKILYSDKINKWLWVNELGYDIYHGFFYARNVKTIKSLCRRIRKWGFPKGAIVRVRGYHPCDTWEIKVY